jgi:RsiW-degrading membrane proteinase PrsW (M82 family)
MENNDQEDKNKQSFLEGLLLLAALLIMVGLGFADNDKTSISKSDVIGLCISGSGFSILFLMLLYFSYDCLKSKNQKPPHEM